MIIEPRHIGKDKILPILKLSMNCTEERYPPHVFTGRAEEFDVVSNKKGDKEGKEDHKARTLTFIVWGIGYKMIVVFAQP